MDDSRDTLQRGGVVAVHKIIETDDLSLVAPRSVLALEEGGLLRTSGAMYQWTQ